MPQLGVFQPGKTDPCEEHRPAQDRKVPDELQTGCHTGKEIDERIEDRHDVLSRLARLGP